MVVYIEYAFLWNFLLDGTLLWLSTRAARRKTGWLRIGFSALVGAAFAVVFPLLSLSVFFSYACKFFVGALLCLFAFGRIKNKNEWGTYALTCLLFFTFTFAFGGAVLGVSGESPKKGIVLLMIALMTVGLTYLIKKLYKKRAVESRIYACVLSYKEKSVQIDGFYDSGNLASYGGTPVCFVSPDVFYDLLGEELAFGEGNDAPSVEICFSTLGGAKRARAWLGELAITEKDAKKRAQKVYFCSATNMLSREYKLLLNARIFDDGVATDKG
ncbi:MAG: hypothetical protein E7355_03660 [Clostridiales bacterium]|nr:hypothetical protein [Clostridiales bacterium]